MDLRQPVALTTLLALSWSCGSSSSPPAMSAGQQPVPSVPPPIDVTFEQRLDAFAGSGVPDPPDYFSMLLGDMDLDGDLDCFVNRHHKVRMRIYENVGGSFVHLNPKGADTSGVYENAWLPDLYEDTGVMVNLIESHGVPGLYVWRGPEKVAARWQFYVLPDAAGTPMPFRFSSNLNVIDVERRPADFTQVDEKTVDIHLQNWRRPTKFSVFAQGSQLKVELTGGDPFPILVGSALVAHPDGRVTIWKRDPHGMTLVDAVGSSYPDLFMSLGGLTGALQAPNDPKTDQLFEHVGSPTMYAEVPPGTIPSGYGRGRRVAWWDVDADGLPELYTSNKQTPNTLIFRDGSGGFVDRAPELGLDLVDPVAFCWLDVDRDGMLDMIYMDDQTIMVAYNDPGGFRLTDGAAIGLELPADRDVASTDLFDPCTFQIVDIDRDGDLDLWVNNYDVNREARVFRRGTSGFEDASEQVGIAGEEHFEHLMLGDLDNDGWIDLITPQDEPTGGGGGGIGSSVAVAANRLRWWRNLGGETFVPNRIGAEFAKRPSSMASLGDVDNDGWLDMIVLTDDHRQLLRNTSSGANTLLEVHLDLPLGTLVRAYYSDGSLQVQQWGAATLSRYTQSLQPLRFGSGPDDRIGEVGVQFPGDRSERFRVSVPAGATRLDL